MTRLSSLPQTTGLKRFLWETQTSRQRHPLKARVDLSGAHSSLVWKEACSFRSRSVGPPKSRPDQPATRSFILWICFRRSQPLRVAQYLVTAQSTELISPSFMFPRGFGVLVVSPVGEVVLLEEVDADPVSFGSTG